MKHKPVVVFKPVSAADGYWGVSTTSQGDGLILMWMEGPAPEADNVRHMHVVKTDKDKDDGKKED